MMVFEGKIANQHPLRTLNSSVRCGKCSKLVDAPKSITILIDGSLFLLYHYIRQSSFIYETKSGRAIVYCSEYCRNKHNHRFVRKERKC